MNDELQLHREQDNNTLPFIHRTLFVYCECSNSSFFIGSTSAILRAMHLYVGILMWISTIMIVQLFLLLVFCCARQINVLSIHLSIYLNARGWRDTYGVTLQRAGFLLNPTQPNHIFAVWYCLGVDGVCVVRARWPSNARQPFIRHARIKLDGEKNIRCEFLPSCVAVRTQIRRHLRLKHRLARQRKFSTYVGLRMWIISGS